MPNDNPIQREPAAPDTEPLSLERFELGEADPARFTHAEHVRIGYELLLRYDYPEALQRFTTGLRRLVDRVGARDKFHMTVTAAFLALIGERMHDRPALDYDGFAAANPDLFERGILLRFYRRERLMSEAARSTFLLPEAVRGRGPAHPG